MGGNGFNGEYPAEKLMRDAKIYHVSLQYVCRASQRGPIMQMVKLAEIRQLSSNKTCHTNEMLEDLN